MRYVLCGRADCVVERGEGMKKLVCGCFGHIYYAKILKDGRMSDIGRIEMTDDAVNAVIDHLAMFSTFRDKGFGGYDIPKKKGGKLKLMLYDADKYELALKGKKNDDSDRDS